MKFDAVRSALALVAFGLTGCLAWIQGDAAADPMVPDAGVIDAAVVGPSTRDAGAALTDAPVAHRADVPLTPPGDPAAREPAAVCAQWHARTDDLAALPAWSAGPTACDPGALPADTRAGAVRYTNAFRWLAGLAPVREDATQTTAAQACAVLVERNGQLSHTPPMSWACWSQVGYQGTSSSNITGVRGFTMTARDAITGWIDDSRDLSHTLGHRRWMLYPPLSTVGYGQAIGYACLHVLGALGNPRDRAWVAWPNAGPTPMAAMTRLWSFSSASLGVGPSTRVAVTRDGVAVAVTAQLREGNYGDPTVSWDMPDVVAASTYAVRVTGLTSGEVQYTVRPQACP